MTRWKVSLTILAVVCVARVAVFFVSISAVG